MKKSIRSKPGLSLKSFSKSFKKIRKVNQLIIILVVLLLVCSIGWRLTTINKTKNVFNNSSVTQNVKVNNDFQAQIYFNDQPRQRIFSKKIIETIRSATKTIEIAIYSFGLEDIRDELYAAAKRGVKVTVILSDVNSLQHLAMFQTAPPGFTIVPRGALQANQIFSYDLHHKFMIVDRGMPSTSLISGSFNWTLRQEYYDPSYLIFSQDHELINVFAQEFDRLLSGLSGPAKLKNVRYNPFPAKINYPNGWLEVWFGPGLSNNSARQRLLTLFDSANKEIDIMMWQLTDKDLADKLIATAQRGINIKFIYDNFPARQTSSVIPYMKQVIKDKAITNFELVSDDKHNKFEASDNLPPNFDSYLHRHEVIIDNNVVWAGTNNWSKAGWWVNDENIIISNNQALVKTFKGSFDFNYSNLK